MLEKGTWCFLLKVSEGNPKMIVNEKYSQCISNR